jgi:hypothetical protein
MVQAKEIVLMPPDEMSPADDRSVGVQATPTLFLRVGVNKGGFLFIPVRDAQGRLDNLSVPLSPCLVRTVYALYDAMQEDSHFLPEARGWRLAEELAELIKHRFDSPIQKETVRGYLTKLKRCVDEAVRRRGGSSIEVPDVIEHKWGFGVRFYSADLNIIDGGDLSSQPSPRPR